MEVGALSVLLTKIGLKKALCIANKLSFFYEIDYAYNLKLGEGIPKDFGDFAQMWINKYNLGDKFFILSKDRTYLSEFGPFALIGKDGRILNISEDREKVKAQDFVLVLINFETRGTVISELERELVKELIRIRNPHRCEDFNFIGAEVKKEFS